MNKWIGKTESLEDSLKRTKNNILKVEQDSSPNFTPSQYDLGVLITEAFRLYSKHHDLIHAKEPEQKYPISKETLDELNKYFLIINHITKYVAKREVRFLSIKDITS